MKNNYAFIILIILLLSFSFSSCKRDNTRPTEDDFTNLNISPDFTFNASKQIVADFTVTPYLSDEEKHIITIYQSDPAAGGRMICKGITNDSFEYSVTFKLADRVKTIFIENRNSDGLYELIEIPVSGNTISHNFNTKDLLYNSSSDLKIVVVDPGCGDNCDQTLSGNYTNLELDGGTYCVEEGTQLTVTNQLKFTKNSSIVICGTASIQQFTTTNNKVGKVYISEPGFLTTSGDLNINDKIHIYNFGNYSISGNVNNKHSVRFFNYGTLNVAGTINNNTNLFTNEGTLNLSGHFNANSNSRFKNYGSTAISGHMNINSNGVVQNYCELIVTGNTINNYKLYNDSYIDVGGTLTLNGSSKLYLRNASLTKTENLMVNGEIKGQSRKYSKIMVADNTTINSSGSVKSKVDLCDENGIEVNNGTIQNSVVFCEILIASDECNPGSEGGGSNEDTDGDGVPDVNDDYPFDAERAFNNYYPNENDYSSFAFEDLWPGLGDYDFNDLVVNINYHIVTNAQNLIVDIITRSNVAAAGASLNNGFGISFPIEPSRCGSITGFVNVMGSVDLNAKGYENGHSENTVAIFYDAINTYYGSSIFNTVPGGNAVVTDTIIVSAYFDNPQIGLGYEPYNPFIYVDQDRGKEVHMKNNSPTALANPDYFGTFNDNSDPQTGSYYLTQNYLPWAIETPVSFQYPVEKADILSAHLKFKEWAESSGTLYQDWYLDEPGYRNEDNIYNEIAQ